MNEEEIKFWDFQEIENRQSFQLAYPRLYFLSKKILQLRKIGAILDIGFGDGKLLEILSKSNLSLFGIDISEKNIQKTKQDLANKNIQANLKIGSTDNIPFEDNKFDIVIATEVLEHLDDNSLKKALKEIKRVLKNEGFFMATVPAYEKLEDSILYCPKCRNVFHRWGHKQEFSEDKLKNILENYFKSIKIKLVTFFWQNKPEKSISKIIKFYIKFFTFRFVKRILGAQYWFFIICQK